MARSKSDHSAYSWMLELSAEGWAWEFLRRNADFREDYVRFGLTETSEALQAAQRWGLLKFADPSIDARDAIVFWAPTHNSAVLPLVTAGEGPDSPADGKCRLSGTKFKTTVLASPSFAERHVLYSQAGRFLQVAISGEGDLGKVRYMVNALPEQSGDRKILALRRLADLFQHRRLRPELYGRQRRGPRLTRLVEILDSCAKHHGHRPVARDVFGPERADDEWDQLRDHVRRAIAAGRKLTQRGYLEFLS